MGRVNVAFSSSEFYLSQHYYCTEGIEVMKFILEKSAVLSFVALKIIVFGALIFVITGCQMSEEELNAIVDERVDQKIADLRLDDWRNDVSEWRKSVDETLLSATEALKENEEYIKGSEADIDELSDKLEAAKTDASIETNKVKYDLVTIQTELTDKLYELEQSIEETDLYLYAVAADLDFHFCSQPSIGGHGGGGGSKYGHAEDARYFTAEEIEEYCLTGEVSMADLEDNLETMNELLDTIKELESLVEKYEVDQD